MARLFPKMHFGQVAAIPAVAHNAVLGWGQSGEIICLRGAGHSGECRSDARHFAALTETVYSRSSRPEQRSREPNDIEHRCSFHPCEHAASRAARKILWTRART